MDDKEFEDFLKSIDDIGSSVNVPTTPADSDFDLFMKEIDALEDLRFGQNSEEALLRDVFKNKPEVVDHYFSKKSKDVNFKITEDVLKQFKVQEDVPELNFGSFSDFFSSAREQKNTDLDRFSNLTGTKMVYPLDNLDDQSALTAIYNATRRQQPLGAQDWKPTFTESLSIGTAEGLSRATKGVATTLAEFADLGLDTNFLTDIEENWSTINLEGNGVADFARFTTQYGIPYAKAVNLFGKIKGYQKLANLGRTGTMGKISNVGAKFGYWAIPGIPAAYLFTSDEKDVPAYALDDIGNMLGFVPGMEGTRKVTRLEEEANLYGSEKAAAAIRNRLRIGLNEGTLTGLFGTAIPPALKYAVGYPLYYVGGAAVKGLNANLNLYALMLQKGYDGMKWAVDGTGKIISKTKPGEKLGTWFDNASKNMFPKFQDWRMYDWTSSNLKEQFKGKTARTLEYLSSTGRFTPETKVASREFLLNVRGKNKKVSAALDELERAVYKLGDDVNQYGQLNNSLRREMLYDNIVKVIKNKPGYIAQNKTLFPTKEMRNNIQTVYNTIQNLKKESSAIAPRLLEGTEQTMNSFYDDIKSYLTQSYAVLRSREKFKPNREIVDEAAAWFHETAKGTGMTLSQSKQVITDIVKEARTGNFSPRTLEETITNKLKDFAPDAPLLKPGETMPQMMQKLLGKETDPRSMIMSTVNEFANLVQQSNFHTKLIQLNDDMIAAGQRPFMFKGPSSEEAVSNFNKFFPGIVGTPLERIIVRQNSRLPIGQEIGEYFTTPSFAKALYDDGVFVDTLNKFEFMRLALFPKTLISAGKTVGSQQTIIRNFTTASTFPMIMGLIGAGTDMTTAFQYVLRDIVGKSKMNSNDFVELVEDYAKRGITDQSATVGELQTLLAEIGSGTLDTTAKLTQKFFNNVVTKKLIDVYQAGDYIWRIYGYHALQSIYKPILKNREIAEAYYSQILKRRFDPLDAAGKEKSILEIVNETSAEMINASFPTYSRVPYITQEIRNFPFLGNFVSFASEMLRSIPQNMLYLRREINFVHPDRAVQEAVRYMGWRRMLGLGTVMGAPAAVTAMAMKGTGVSEEMMQAYKDSAAPPYAKTGVIPLSAPDEDGNFWINNLQTVFPHYAFIAAFDDLFKERTEEAFFKRLKKRIFGDTILSPLGEDRDPGVIDHLFGPLMDVPIVYEILGEIALNRKRSGSTIYNPDFDNLEEVLNKSFSYFWEKARPTTFTQIEDTTQALNKELEASGKPRNLNQQLLKWFAGFSTSEFNPKKSYGYTMSKVSRNMGIGKSGFNKTINGAINPTKQLSFDTYKKELVSHFIQSKKLKKVIDDFMVLGVDEDTILEQIRRPNLGTSLERAMDNEFNPRFIDYDDTNLNNKAEELGKDIEDIIDFDRIEDLADKLDGLSLDTPLEDFIQIIETGQLPDTEFNFDDFLQSIDDIDLSSTTPVQQPVTQTTVPQFPITQPQATAAAPQVAPSVATGTAQGVTPTETALLSPTELAIRQRNRGTV